MACNTLRCLTVFKNTMMHDDDHSKDAPNYDLHLSTLKLIHDDEINDWKIRYTLNLMKKLRLILFCLDNWLNRFKGENFLRKVLIAFLFHTDVTMNKGVCMIHEGLKIPGRGSKCSSLIREFLKNCETQYNITQGEERPKLIFGSNVFTRSLNKNTSLSISEYRNMQENLEHDRMVCGNYDRQSIAFLASRDDKFHYTFNNKEGLIDEINFLSCKRHENSKLLKKGWTLTHNDKVTGFKITVVLRGLRSLCPNAYIS